MLLCQVLSKNVQPSFLLFIDSQGFVLKPTLFLFLEFPKKFAQKVFTMPAGRDGSLCREHGSHDRRCASLLRVRDDVIHRVRQVAQGLNLIDPIRQRRVFVHIAVTCTPAPFRFRAEPE